MISFILIIIASALNAVMDRLENESFFSSDLRDLNQSFWYKRVSYKVAKKIFGWKLDGWHMVKSLMIIDITFAIVAYRVVFGFWIDFLLIGLIWNATFGLTYKLLNK